MHARMQFLLLWQLSWHRSRAGRRALGNVSPFQIDKRGRREFYTTAADPAQVCCPSAPAQRRQGPRPGVARGGQADRSRREPMLGPWTSYAPCTVLLDLFFREGMYYTVRTYIPSVCSMTTSILSLSLLLTWIKKSSLSSPVEVVN
jgi:hypothetical protein